MAERNTELGTIFATTRQNFENYQRTKRAVIISLLNKSIFVTLGSK
jgi:hypothetical protein